MVTVTTTPALAKVTARSPAPLADNDPSPITVSPENNQLPPPDNDEPGNGEPGDDDPENGDPVVNPTKGGKIKGKPSGGGSSAGNGGGGGERRCKSPFKKCEQWRR